MEHRGLPAVFLDRDGTINLEKNYLYRIEEFVFIGSAPEAIRRLNDAGYLVVVVTNQSGVARGYYSLEDVEKLHKHIEDELAGFGASIQGFYTCPHHLEEGGGEYSRACDCRKGRPGLLFQAAEDLDIDLTSSFMIGDKLSDVEAAENSGCTPFLVLTGHGKSEQHRLAPGRAYICDDLAGAVDLILAKQPV
jgi:D-glycero-D-manno-heptose 1,7-bisphosphate phosphatase